MVIYSYASFGYEGELVTVEVDLRPALPGFEIVGLPDSAIREAKERIRVAIRNSGFEYPLKRILVNLYPAGIPKTGAAFDLPVALGILAAAGVLGKLPERILALGELQLSGRVRAVDGVLAALHESDRLGNLPRLIPSENGAEAASAGSSSIWLADSLVQAAESVSGCVPPKTPGGSAEDGPENRNLPDFGDMAGFTSELRALQIAAAGGHHLMLCGPPGAGKSMAALRFPSVLPPLSRQESLEVTRIYSVAGKLPRHAGLIRSAPFRKPHHSASREGLIGGGAALQPGEVSLAHNGVLLLDEAAEFQAGVLQSLREPVEQRRVDLVRAGRRAWFPARFQLLLTLNPCPCGNLGKEDGICLCSEREIYRYWRTLGGALLDRIDIRIPVRPADPASLLCGGQISSAELLERIKEARLRSQARCGKGVRTADLDGHALLEAAALDTGSRSELLEQSRRCAFSNRAVHSILRVAMTIADLDSRDRIRPADLAEAASLRSFGENEFYSGVRLKLGA
jgi:magnesium chelatase family protein